MRILRLAVPCILLATGQTFAQIAPTPTPPTSVPVVAPAVPTAAQTPPPASAAMPAPAPTTAAADDAMPLWMRYPALSPDGKTVAFAFRGHLFTVPSAGGSAIPLTAGPAHEFAPVWSPDGKSLAYASDAYGNFDVYLLPLTGGAAKRLTTYSTEEIPTAFTPDGKTVLFASHRQDSKANAQFPSGRVMPELYRVSIEPGRAPEQVFTTPALAAHYNKAGDRLFTKTSRDTKTSGASTKKPASRTTSGCGTPRMALIPS